jgi:hypothetical protein
MNSSKTCQPDDADGSALETLLTESEFARIVKRSLASIRRDRKLGTGCPYLKLGALVRYRPADVRRFIEFNLRGIERRNPASKDQA